MDPLEILGRAYSLLSECRSEELRAAAAVAESEQLSRALRALASVKSKIEVHQNTRAKHTPVQMRKKKTKPIELKTKNAIDSDLEPLLKKVVYDETVFPRNVDLAAFLNTLGFSIAFRKKDGRAKMFQRLEQSLYEASQSKRKSALIRLLEILPKSQTEGWFDAIRGEI